MNFEFPTTFSQIPVGYTDSTNTKRSFQDSLDDLSYYETRVNEEGPSIELSRDILNARISVESQKSNIKQKLKDISTKLESIVREFHYKENDDYARARLKQINLELDALSKEIQGMSE